ncbi:MAG: hypothetical protein ACR2KB_02490 [Chitinophagaceae bacterium]|jgi:uncharacterized lipoprotein NlpE involved in copper resistance
MKRLLSMALIFSVLGACNNQAEADGTVKDSVLEIIDSTAQARIDSIQRAKDSIQSQVETSFEKTDSANKALADSARKN